VRGVGKDLPSALGAWYAAHGYAFLGISDMNTYTWPEEYGNRALPGVPTVDATYAFADVLAVGIDHWLPAQTLQEVIDWIAADGGLPVLAAPLSPAKPQPLVTVMGLHGLYGLEVFDARLAVETAGGADATALWDRLLSAGNRVYAVAGDDATGVIDPAIGGAWISVLAPANDQALLLSSLRRGAFVASNGAEFTSLAVAGTTITAEAAPGSSLRFIGRGGQLLKTVTARAGSYRVNGNEGYVRVELYQGHCYFIPQKLARKQEGLHLPHLCRTEKEEDPDKWLKASQDLDAAGRGRVRPLRTRSGVTSPRPSVVFAAIIPQPMSTPTA